MDPYSANTSFIDTATRFLFLVLVGQGFLGPRQNQRVFKVSELSLVSGKMF